MRQAFELWLITVAVSYAVNKFLRGKKMSEIATGALGPETSYDVEFTKGALQVSLKYAGAQASMSVVGSISGSQLVEALAAKLTNPLEIELLNGLAAIIAAIP